MKKTVLLILVTLASMISIKAQYYVKVKGDTTHMETDSVLLSVDNSYGKVSWQVSTDSIKWMDLEEGNILPVWIDSLGGYRATAVNENCPVISDTIVAGIIKTRVGYNFSMDDKGIVYELPSGLNIIVPPNAISGVNSLSVQEFDSIQAKSSLPFPADSGKAFIYAMKFNPSNTNLLKPVKIRIPTSKYDRGDLPRIFLFNSETDEWTNYTGDILCNRQFKYIELTLSSLQPFRMDACPSGLFITDEKKTQLKSIGKQNNKGSENDPCYDLIRIKSEVIDLTTILKNQECFFIDEEGSVEFLLCPTKPKDYWHIREIGKNCEPKVEVKIDDDANKEFIKIGDDVVLTFFTYIYAGEEKNPLPDQFISFNLPAGLISDTNYVWTDKDGTRDLQVTATSENLNALINYTVHYNYCPELIEASSTNSFEGACQQKNITSDFDGIKKVIIYDDCTDPGSIDCSISDDQACQSIKDELPISISLLPEHQILNFNDEFPLMVVVNNDPHLNNSSLAINWSSSDQTIASVNSQGRVTSNSTEGTVIITARVCELEPATSTIEVQNITCDSAKVTVSPLSVNITVGGQYPIDIEYGASANGETYIPIIKFSSINTGYATVDDNGIIHGIIKGQTTVVVSWCEKSFNINVTVEEADYCDNANVEVSTYPIYLSIGENHRIAIRYHEISPGNLYVPKVTFTSTNNSIASVNSNGVVQAISKGEATIIVKWCDKTVNIMVSVESINGTFIDGRDGQEYKWVKIGQQIWMAENINYSVDDSHCYDNKPRYCDVYGRLYTYAQALGACPPGWHLPTDMEWKTLEMYLGMTQEEADRAGDRGTYIGGKMKEAGFEHWTTPNSGATNESGFTGLPGGTGNPLGEHDTTCVAQGGWNCPWIMKYVALGKAAYFWTSTAVQIYPDVNPVYYRSLKYQSSGVWRDVDWPNNLPKSVRCIKN